MMEWTLRNNTNCGDDDDHLIILVVLFQSRVQTLQRKQVATLIHCQGQTFWMDFPKPQNLFLT